MTRSLVDTYLRMAVNLESRDNLNSAYYTLNRAIEIEESQLKHTL